MSGLSVFAFGKLPAHGDFVARGLEAAERDAWDAWASAGLAQARAALGEAFDPAHDAAPPWRFAFGAPEWGPRRMAGAFAPSVDRAGRRFLIVLGAAAAAGLDPDGAGGAVAERAEAEIYRAFAAGEDVDALVDGARAAVAGLDPGADGDGRFWTLGATDEDARALSAVRPPDDLLLTALGG